MNTILSKIATLNHVSTETEQNEIYKALLELKESKAPVAQKIWNRIYSNHLNLSNNSNSIESILTMLSEKSTLSTIK